MLTLWKYLEDKKAEEEGEVASWLILAAGLAAAAGIASEILTGTITRLAQAVGNAG